MKLRMISIIFSGSALLIAQPVLAQKAEPVSVATKPAPKAPAKPDAPIDSARLTLATTTAKLLLPEGAYEKMLQQTFSEMIPGMMGSVFGSMKPSDIVPGSVTPDDPDANKTMAELMAEEDPHFEERTTIMMKVVGDAMAPIMRKMEPKLRDAMAKSFARKFSAKELGDMNVFFASPAGQAYANNYLLLMMDAEYLNATMEMMPEMMGLMGDLDAKIKAATAHLPEPKNIAAEGALLMDVAVDVTKLPPCAIDGQYADCIGADRDKLIAAFKAEGYDYVALEKAQAKYDAEQVAAEAKYAAEEAARKAKAAALRAAWNAKDRAAVEKLEKQMVAQQVKADGEMSKVYGLEESLAQAKRNARKNAGQPEEDPEEASAGAMDAAKDAAAAAGDAVKGATDAMKEEAKK
jgi:Uncharacterized protein conserved in bacteria (DUF2059)